MLTDIAGKWRDAPACYKLSHLTDVPEVKTSINWLRRFCWHKNSTAARMIKPPYQVHCEKASAKLRALSCLVKELEDDILDYEEDPADLMLCTRLVGNVMQASHQIDTILYEHVPALQAEDESVAYAVQIACESMAVKVVAVRRELDLVSSIQPRRRRAAVSSTLLS